MNNENILHDSKVMLDEITGEIIYLTNKEVKLITKSRNNHLKIGDVEHRKSNDLFKTYIDETCGNFYFNYYNKYEVNQYIFRYLYLCTFMGYDSYLEFGNSKNENRLVKKRDLFEILKLSEKECYRTINYLFDNELLYFDKNEYIKINSDICIKGKIKNKKEVVRMFNDAIQEIYENSLPKEHKKLALLIKILPLVHFDKNVVCKNPTEKREELIEPYSLIEISELMGYSSVQILKRGLLSLKVHGEPAVMISNINNNIMLVINPKIYYKGNNLDKMQGIISLFNISKNNL